MRLPTIQHPLIDPKRRLYQVISTGVHSDVWKAQKRLPESPYKAIKRLTKDRKLEKFVLDFEQALWRAIPFVFPGYITLDFVAPKFINFRHLPVFVKCLLAFRYTNF
jgi:hypothetical protein